MSSKIELEFPYTEKWETGYLLYNSKEDRWYVQLIGGTKNSITSYARYKMSVHLGRFLNPDEHVDHIDENRKNDSIDNLQILSSAENARKHVIASGKAAKFEEIQCPQCGETFEISVRNLKSRKKNNKNIYCSRSCNAKASREKGGTGKSSISDEMVSSIRSLRSEGLSSYKISEKLGIARNTVMKYWKE